MTEPCVYDSDADLARAVLASPDPALAGITLERLKREGWRRLEVPTPFVPFAPGFPTPSGRLQFVSPAMAEAGLDPVPAYTPPAEATQHGTDLARRFPLALIAPASHYLLNSMFANVPELERRQGAPAIVLHPADAEARGLREGDVARVYNDRGAFQALVRVSDAVRPGVVAASKGFWPKRVAGGANANATVAERDSDMGGGAVFHDNRVRVLQPLAQHQHAGDGDDGRMAEAGEGVRERHQPRRHAGQQGGSRHHVVPPAAPEEHGHRGQEHAQDETLIARHGSMSSADAGNSSGRASWPTLGTTGSVPRFLLKPARIRRIRASRFSVELKS